MNTQTGNELGSALLEIIRRFGSKGVNGACCADLSMAEYFALEGIAGLPECSVHDIGARLGFTKSGATRIVDRLEKKGYAKRIVNEADKRVCCVEITEHGMEMLSTTVSRFSAELANLLGHLSEDSRTEIERALRTLATISAT